jgi:hypothetical protein
MYHSNCIVHVCCLNLLRSIQRIISCYKTLRSGCFRSPSTSWPIIPCISQTESRHKSRYFNMRYVQCFSLCSITARLYIVLESEFDLLGDYMLVDYEKFNSLYFGVSNETKYAFPKVFLSFCWHNLKLHVIISEFHICISDNTTCRDSSGRVYFMVHFM